ncbi:pseudouridylate synthase [Lactobacillus rhamnosus GG] [Lactiplantibacillus plantarum]|nr:pseudouridylate synthase [Lactobacillus rhamnosus GG] [Lactiplantibacillus plantarum]
MSDTFTITTESGRIDKIITAHETRHDLVCRLLLEKKKNNT